MDRIAVFTLAYFLAPFVQADVFYTCDSRGDYIEITDGYYGKMEPAVAQAETISASDAGLATAIVRHCRLSSGMYVVTFVALRPEDRAAGVDSGDHYVTVAIEHEGGIPVPGTVIGKCDIPQSRDLACREVGAVEIRLSGRTGHVQLLRLVNY